MSRKERIDMYAVLAACATAPAFLLLGPIGLVMIPCVALAAVITELLP